MGVVTSDEPYVTSGREERSTVSPILNPAFESSIEVTPNSAYGMNLGVKAAPTD